MGARHPAAGPRPSCWAPVRTCSACWSLAQSASWLLVSLPAGAWIGPHAAPPHADRGAGTRPHRLDRRGRGGGHRLRLPAWASLPSPGASGTVVYVLTSVSLLPSLVAPGDLPRSNARRRTGARCCQPRGTLRGRPARATPVADLGLRARSPRRRPRAGLRARSAGRHGPDDRRRAAPPSPAPSASARPSSCATKLLRGISLCAIFWNFAFFALLAIWVPLRPWGPSASTRRIWVSRAVDLWGRPDPGRAGGTALRPPPTAVRDPDLRAGRVGGRRFPVPGGPLGQWLCPRRGRIFPGGLRADAVADLPDDGAPARDAVAADGPRQRHGPDRDLRLSVRSARWPAGWWRRRPGCTPLFC